MKNPFGQALGISLGSIAYDLTVRQGWKSVDSKKAVFLFAFSWLVLWLFSKKASANRSKEVSA